MSDNLREPSAPAAIMATFSDWRTVKSRKALQLVFEVSLEQQAEVLTMLGAPLPDDPRWCAIALMNTPSRHGDGERPANGGQSPGMHSGRGASLSQPGAAESAHRGSFSVGEPTGMGGASDGRRDKTPAERAVIRAALLPKDERFRAWVTGQRYGRDLVVEVIVSEDQAADFIREHCCGGKSRKLIGEVPEYMDRFRTMLTEFQIAVGEMAAPR